MSKPTWRYQHPGFCGRWFNDHLGYGLSQWETTLHCNVVSCWLNPCTEWSLRSMASLSRRCIISAAGACGSTVQSMPTCKHCNPRTLQRPMASGHMTLFTPSTIYLTLFCSDCAEHHGDSKHRQRDCLFNLSRSWDIIIWERFPRYWPTSDQSLQRTRRFDVFFDVSLNKPLTKQSSCRWFETQWRPCDVIVIKSLSNSPLQNENIR